MQLANDLKRALGKRKAGPWKANGYAVSIKQGKAKLSGLIHLAKEASCSLTYLTSGGNFEAKEDLKPRDAVLRSITHKGYDKHDFGRMLGFPNFNRLSQMLENGTLPVKVLMKIADTLEMEVWEVLCDNEYTEVDLFSSTPSDWDQMVELNLMGWLDSKPRDKYEKDKGPGI